MNRKRSFIGFLSVIAIGMIVTAGCEQKDTLFGTQISSIYPVKNSSGSPPAAVTNTEKGSGTSVNNKEASTEKSNSKSNGTVDAKISDKLPFTQSNPTLLGLTVKSSVDEVKANFGKPNGQFIMDDNTDPITVYDYTRFLIGFDKKNQLRFIEIRSTDMETGLNGLKLGDPLAEVYKSLGKPDVNTNLVLTYKASGATLKIDLDPKTQTVNSIKLFAEQ